MNKSRRGENRSTGVRVWQGMMEGNILLSPQHDQLLIKINCHEFRDCVHIGKLFNHFYSVIDKDGSLASRYRARTVALKSVLQSLNLLSIEKGIVRHEPK